MATHPSQQLTLLALGLAALAILALAGYILYRTNRRQASVTAVRSPDASSSDIQATVVSEPAGRRRRAVGNWIAAALLLGVFAGKYLVGALYASGDEAPDVVPSKVMKIRGESGAELSVAHYGSPEGQGPTLVFTHGWGADRRDWLYAIRNLPPALHVVAWDLPGLGESTPPSRSDYSMSMMAKDLDRIVTSLDRPVVLIGHSVGGIINIEYARQFPAKLGSTVRGLVQANTTFTNPIETKKNAELSRKLQEPVLEPLLHGVAWTSPVARALGWLAYQSGLAHLQLAAQSFAGAQTWQQLDEMARYAYRSSPGVVSRGVLAMLKWDGSDVLPRIAVPTLIISGNEDVTTLPWASDRMARDIRSSERIAVSRAAHLGPVEQHKRYAEAIASFAAKASGGANRTPVAQADVPANR